MSTRSRRQFLRMAAAPLAAAGVPAIVPASALGAGGAVAPRDRITVGCIGVGWMGAANVTSFLEEPGAQVVAVCDVDSEHLAGARELVNSKYQNKDCAAYRNFEELLARTDIDAVMIATPDHWHGVIGVAALRAGKDVYGEKPLARTPAERAELARVVSSALRRSDSASVSPVMAADQSTANADLRGALLSVMAQVGKDESLPVLRAALKDDNPELRRGAIRALSDWPNTTPMNDLADIARSDPTPVFQVLALQGYIRLIGVSDGRPPAVTVKMLSEAMSLAQRAEEKKAVLSRLQTINTAEALALAEAAARDPEVAGEASLAAERIRQRLAPRRRPQ